MLNLHEILVQLRNDLGYKKDDEGVCALFAETGLDAVLVGEYGTVFRERCEFITRHYQELPTLYQQIQAEAKVKRPSFFPVEKEKTHKGTSYTTKGRIAEKDRQMILDVVAFMELGELYLHPDHYRDIFPEPLSQYQTQKISSYVQSIALEKLGGRASLASFIGVYSTDELTKYMKQLNQLAKDFSCNLALSLGSDNHRIAVCYSQVKKCWDLIDANQPFPDSIPATDKKMTALAEMIFLSFEDNLKGNTAFSTQLFTTGEHQPKMQALVDGWRQKKELVAIHDISLEHAKRKTRGGVTLAWLAARVGDTAILNRIIELGPEIELNKVDKNGTTPVLIAAQNGHTDALRILMQARTSDGKLAVDINKAKPNGATAAFVAAQNGDTEVLCVLMEAKTPDGNLVVDLNLARKDGATPVFVAAQNGHVNALGILVDARGADGRRVVNLSLAHEEGATPILSAAQQGHADALRVLIKAFEPDELIVELNRARKDGSTPILMAAKNGRVNAVRALMEPKKPNGEPVVELNLVQADGATSAFMAAQSGHANVLLALMENITSTGDIVVDLNISNKDGATPAMIATQMGHVDALRVLLGARKPDGSCVVDFNKATTKGASPIHIAALLGRLDIVEILLEANVNLTSLCQGMTALQFAELKGHHAIVEAIKHKLVEQASPDSAPRP